MRGNYNGALVRFRGNQLPPFMANRNETNLKKASLKQKQNSLQIMLPVANNKKVDSNTKLENPSVDFNTLNYPEESINSYDTVDESE